MNSAMGLLLLPSWLRSKVPSLFSFLHSSGSPGHSLLFAAELSQWHLQAKKSNCEYVTSSIVSARCAQKRRSTEQRR